MDENVKKKVFLFDVDGTLAIREGREPFEWEKVGEDLPNKPIVAVLQSLSLSGHNILYISGRPESVRLNTELWIRNNCVVEGELLMRPNHDNRKDSIVKKEIFETRIFPDYEVIAIFDDRDQVVRMWRDELKQTCCQVADGNF